MKNKLDVLIDEILATGLFLGPEDITKTILARKGEVDWDQVLHSLVTMYVSRELARRRSRTLGQRQAHKRPQQHESVEADNLPAVRRLGAPLSARVAGIRELAREWLNEQVAVGDRVWKQLGKCTQEDMVYLVKNRLKMSDSLKRQANQYQRWLELMRLHNVNTLEELPSSALDS